MKKIIYTHHGNICRKDKDYFYFKTSNSKSEWIVPYTSTQEDLLIGQDIKITWLRNEEGDIEVEISSKNPLYTKRTKLIVKERMG